MKPQNGGSDEKLSKAQSEKLEAHLQQHTYLYVKDIIAYVLVAFKVAYTVPGMRSWLERHGFSYKKPAIVPGKANTGRSIINLAGSIDVITYKIVVQEDQTLNSGSKSRRLIRYKQKIHIFSDNAPYYRNNAVKQYLKASKISLHFLPPYSHNLNPIEQLDKFRAIGAADAIAQLL